MKKIYFFLCLLFCSASVFAQTSYTSTAVATAWNAARWNNTADAPPYTATFTANNIASFTAGTYTFAGMGATINVGNVIVASGVTVNFASIANTYATGGLVRTIDVGSGGLFDFNAQAISTAVGTGLIKNGTGVFATGAGTFTGGFTLNAGTLIVRSTTGMGSGGTNTLTLNGGTVAANTTRILNNTRYPSGIIIAGNIQFGEIPANVTLASNTANLTFDNNVSLGAANRTLTLGNAAINTFTGIISNTSGGLTIAANANGATGSVVISGANTYSGGTTVNGGILICGAVNTIPAAGTMTLGGGTLRTGTAAGFTQSTGTLNLTNNSNIILGTGVHSLSFANSNAVSWTAGQMITVTGWTGGYDGTSGTNGQIFVGTDATGLTPGQLAQIQFFDGAVNHPALILSTGEVVPDVAVGTPDILLSSPNPAVAAGNILQGSTSLTNNPIYRFDLAVTTLAATLNGVTINTAGTYAATDITNFKCWYSTDATFSPLTDVLLSTNAAPAAAGAQVFPAFTNQVIANGATGFIFITADVPCAAVVGNDISVNAITTGDISFVAGNETGSAFAGGLQTITLATPNDVTVPAASVANASSSLSWVTPAGCYDAVLIVARALIANDGIPSGDGTAYTGNLAFPTGTPLGSGFVVYNGPSTSPQVVTGLTNGTLYFYKFFTRRGTTWTAGVEVSATPLNVTAATDYFRSVAPGGNWGSVATWESSPDDITYIPSSLVPTAAANTIRIRNTADVTVAAAAGGDQIIVDAGATLTLNANFTLANPAGTDLDVFGTVINTSGTHTFTGTADFHAGTLYQHNRNGGAVPTAVWDVTSTLEVTGATSAAPTNITQTLGNFTWNSNTTTTTNLVGTLTTVAGNFRVQNSGTTALRLTGTADLNLTVSGNFTIEDNLDIDNNATGVCNVSIGGNFSHTGGDFGSSSDVAIITMTGVARTFTQSGGVFTSTNLNWIINSGASTTLANNLPTSVGRTVLVDGTLDASTLQITGAGDVTVNGTLRTAHADGLEITGTLANSGTKALGVASTVDYYAAGAQIFSSRADYANVIINGGGNKTLNGTATLSGILTLTNGYIVTTAVNLITLTNTATVPLGGSNASFVHGPIKKTGNSDFIFPVGKTSFGYVPIEITLFVGGTATDEFTAEYMRGSARALGPVVAGPGLDHVSGCDYWTLNKNTVTPATVDVTGYWSAANGCNGTYVDDLPSLTIAHFEAAVPGWDLYALTPLLTGGSTIAAGSVKWPLVAVFSPFALASTTFGLNPLPITVNYFNGAKQSGNHLLNWKVTCTNTPSVTMQLERSTDGRNYAPVYSITATALQCQQPFNHTDANPAAGINYYRLKMTDANGKITYSTIVSLLNATKGFDIMNIAPNPIVNGNFKLNVSAAQKTQMDIVVTDMQGRIMQKQTVSLIAGFTSIPMNVANLSTGTYQVYGYTADGRSRALRFVIQ